MEVTPNITIISIFLLEGPRYCSKVPYKITETMLSIPFRDEIYLSVQKSMAR